MRIMNPCPFCGGNNLQVVTITTPANEYLRAVSCEDCRARGSMIKGQGPGAMDASADAIRAWNSVTAAEQGG